MPKYEVRLIIDTDEGNPRKWLWNDLIGGTSQVVNWEATLLEEESNESQK